MRSNIDRSKKKHDLPIIVSMANVVSERSNDAFVTLTTPPQSSTCHGDPINVRLCAKTKAYYIAETGAAT